MFGPPCSFLAVVDSSRSDHTSPKYGQHYTIEEIHDLFAPSEESVQSVRDWLESAGVHGDRITLSANKQWLQFDADAEEVERLLRTEYYVHTDSVTGKSHVACHELVTFRYWQ